MVPTHGAAHSPLQRRLQIFGRLGSRYDVSAESLEEIHVALFTQCETIAVPPFDNPVERPDMTQLGEGLYGLNGLIQMQDEGR
jgi:hypothetical protein